MATTNKKWFSYNSAKVAAEFEKNMKESLLKHLSKKETLDEKLNFLTNLSLRCEKYFETCEEIRYELVCQEDGKEQIQQTLRINN